MYIYCQLPNRYNLVRGGSFLKLLFLKRLYFKTCTTSQVNRTISPPLDERYAKKNAIWFL